MHRNIVLDVLFIVEVFENKYYYYIITYKSHILIRYIYTMVCVIKTTTYTVTAIHFYFI